MIPQKVKDHIEEYISQEVYVQIAIIKGKEKISTESAIDKYFNTNHFRDFSEGKPYFHFIDGLRDKCLGKLKNSPMRDKETEDETIKLLQKKLNNLTHPKISFMPLFIWWIRGRMERCRGENSSLGTNHQDLLKIEQKWTLGGFVWFPTLPKLSIFARFSLSYSA